MTQRHTRPCRRYAELPPQVDFPDFPRLRLAALQWPEIEAHHLAAVGAVDECELVCAAHFWRFDSSGTGTRRYSDGTREPTRDLRTFTASEHDGWVGAELPD